MGINTAIISGGQGIGFAIPINMAKALLPQLKEKGKVVTGVAGRCHPEGDPGVGQELRPQRPGGSACFGRDGGSPAAKADIKRGDVIVSFDGKAIREMDQLPKMVAAMKVGKKVKVGLIREGKPIEVRLPLPKAARNRRIRPKHRGPRSRKTSAWWSRTSHPKSHSTSISGTEKG